jgi:phosphoglycolate phosphatase-like HAD superfamily hydrolase
MAFQAIIADWNGTLISDRNETPILKNIAVDIAKFLFPLHPLKLAKLFKAQQELNRIYEERRRDEEFDFVREMYRIYNEKIIKGTSMSVIRHSVERYAVKPEVQGKLDFRILKILRKYHDENKTIGVLSAGYADGIDRILVASSYRDSFDFLVADTLEENDGKAFRLLLNIYKHKAPLLEKLLEERKINKDEIVYIGDSEDDEGCFQLVKYPIVSFFAPDDFKNHCTKNYGAFVPRSEKDLMEFFERIN